MLRFSCFGLLFFFLTCLHAQVGDFQPLLQLDPDISNDTDIHILPDEAGELTIVFIGQEEAQIFLLGEDMEVSNSFRISDLPSAESHDFLGFTNMPEALHFCYQDKNNGEYEVLTVDKTGERLEWFGIDMGRLPRHNVYWGSFTHEGILHILRMPRGGNSVRLCRFEGGKQFSNQEFELTSPEILQKAQYQFTRVETDSSEGLGATWHLGKMYLQDDRIYLSLDELGATHLVEIDLLDGMKEEWVLPAPGFAVGRDQLISVKNNSLILGQELYQIATSEDSLKMVIRDLEEDSILAAYAYDMDNLAGLLAGNWVAQGLDGQSILLEDAQSWLNALANFPYLALSGTVIQDSLLELVIGGVKPSRNVGLTGMILDEEVRTCYFQALLHLDSFSPAHTSPSELAVHRFPPPAFWNKPYLQGFSWQGYKHLLYYDPEINQVIVGIVQ